jgi:hypothetical protein
MYYREPLGLEKKSKTRTYNKLFCKEVSLAQLAMGVDVQPRHPGSNPHGYLNKKVLFIVEYGSFVSSIVSNGDVA